MIPLRPGPLREGYRPAVMVLIVDPDAGHSTSVERCRAVFGFTCAEAEVAIGIMEGLSLEQIAAQQQRAIATVRNLLKRVFQKADVSRQHELTRLMLYSPILLPALTEPSAGQRNTYEDLNGA